MPTQEELNALQVELDIAADNEIRARDRMEQYEKVFTAITEMPAEERKKLDTTVIQNAIDDYKATKQALDDSILREATAEFTLRQYQNAIAQQQAEAQQQQGATYRRKTIDREVPQEEVVEEWAPVYNNKGEIVGSQKAAIKLRPNISRPKSFTGRKAARTPTIEEVWEDVYNSGGWNEFKKGFNNAVVDDLVMPVASALGASEDTMGVLSELKMPATEREMASKYYAYGGRGKDAADAALQYLGLKGVGEILGGAKTVSPAYTVANSGKGIYNTPNAWQTVNRFGSNYAPAYWGNGVKALKTAGNSSTTSVAPRQFWRYVESHQDAPILSTINNFKNNLL